MRSMSQCFNIVYLAVGFTAGQLTVPNGQTALGYPFTPNGPRRLLLALFGPVVMSDLSPACTPRADVRRPLWICGFTPQISYCTVANFGISESRLTAW